MEEFTIIPGHSDYEISRIGVIRKVANSQIIAQVLTGGTTYYYVNIYADCGKRVLRRVHRLLAITFIPNPDNLAVVDHIDQNRFNNDLENLRWVDSTTNARNTRCNIIPGGLRAFVMKNYHGNMSKMAVYSALFRRKDDKLRMAEYWDSLNQKASFPIH